MIDLCDTNNLPSISLDILRTSYVRLDELMKKPKLRELHGISEDPPWDVLMPAYLFHGADHLNARRRSTYRVPSQPREVYVSYPATK